MNKTYECRKCGFTIEADERPEMCPHCERMFYDEFSSTGITTYPIMKEVKAKNEALELFEANAAFF